MQGKMGTVETTWYRLWGSQRLAGYLGEEEQPSTQDHVPTRAREGSWGPDRGALSDAGDQNRDGEGRSLLLTQGAQGGRQACTQTQRQRTWGLRIENICVRAVWGSRPEPQTASLRCPLPPQMP